ncbi:hypothetical protein FISHEDRAFT_74389 [Fistulina hepatica ATCC 64428]|uniref:UBX domain-containing protein n=1 Tax=Fistulina hepatica ATCC 64428 TaxID=1128425 RepID=A0A0D7AA54_9AGAR|nr:hypothetical protein FISHEDRAFT_74389 [Fistulina hepatica ATCC 64428]
MTTNRDTLLSMGFDSARVDWALRATKNSGLQPAMDHILDHDGQPVPEVSSGDAATESVDIDEDDAAALGIHVPVNVGSEAKSIRCSVCGKVFKNTELANYHAEKSGHDQFEESTEEIKPLTEEEKKQRLEELRERMAAKRAVKAQEQAKEDRANEVIRRKAGKDLNKIKDDLKLKEAEKEAKQKIKDKIEERKARERVRAQIEADKRERAEKAAREKALRMGQSAPQPAPAVAPTPAAQSTGASKDHKETRLRIRMSTGAQYELTLPSDAPLSEVAEYLASQTLDVNADTVTLSEQFPKRVFKPEEFSKSLRDLKLTPSAVLVASP